MAAQCDGAPGPESPSVSCGEHGVCTFSPAGEESSEPELV